MSVYLREHAAHKPSAAWIADIATNILEWWGDRPLSDIRGETCRQYLAWRTAQPTSQSKNRLVSVATARHELGVLRAAIKHYNREHGPLTAVPEVTLPPKSPPRQDYFLTRSEIAKRIRAARRRPETAHLVRLLLVGLFSGTRTGAMLRLRWVPSVDSGWVDLQNEVIHRQPSGAVRSKKRAPPCRIHRRLLPHLRRWQREDQARGIAHLIHYNGKPITTVRWAWETVRKEVGATRKDSPHVLRHSSATMFMSWGLDLPIIAGYLGMSVQTLEAVYLHHHPMFQQGIAQSTPRKRAN